MDTFNGQPPITDTFLVLFDKKPSIVDKKYLFQRKNIIFWQSCQIVLPWCVKQIVEKNTTTFGVLIVFFKNRYDLSGALILGQQK